MQVEKEMPNGQMRTKRLHGMLEMVYVIMLATIYMYVVGAMVVIVMMVDE